MVTLARNLDFSGSCVLTRLTAIFVARLRQALTRKMCALTLLIRRHHCFSFWNSATRTLLSPCCRCFARPTRIAVGSRRVRISGSFPLIARTATPSPSSKGSETISKRSPYIVMCMDGMKPRSLILTQRSDPICTLFTPFSSSGICEPKTCPLFPNGRFSSYATSFLSITVGTCTNSSNRER